MKNSRMSPITFKKETQFSSRRRSETPIDQILAKIQQKLKLIQFNNESQNHIHKLQNILPSVKSVQKQIKEINQLLTQVGISFSNRSPQRNLKNQRNVQQLQNNNHARLIANLERQAQNLQQEIQTYSTKKGQSQKAHNDEENKRILNFKQQLKQKLRQFQKQVYEAVNQVRISTSNSRIVYDDIIQNKIKASPALQQLQSKKKQYQKIIGMLWCMKKTKQDVCLKQKVKQNYEKTLKLTGTNQNNHKKLMNQILIDSQKKQTIDKLNNQILNYNEDIIKQANLLKQQIRQIEDIYNVDQQVANYKFNLFFARLQKLRNKIQGISQKFKEDFEKIQQIMILSKPKVYSIQHKDNELVKCYRQFSELKQNWQKTIKMLNFQYCSY